MTKTFIYGVPNGFDFFEKDAEFNDYFKGFYISSRRGRRLMINRRDNGETVYSYLRYGLKEVERQPLHSFFGMSLVVDNYQFCPNFKLLLGWFDYLFNRLVNERNIIKTNEDGVLHYVIHKFEENTTDVEWLKINLPNILKQTDQVEIINYDSSFEEGKAGQIVSFNQPVSEGRLLETFKKYRWISVAAEIVEKEEISDVANDTAIIELNYEDLNNKLNEFNQLLLPIAIDISKGSYDDLKKISEEVQEICSSLAKFIPTLGDSDEKDKFSILESKYDSLKNSISTLMSKMGHVPDPPQPETETQYCYSCKKNMPLSHFRSPEATKCKECEERDRINNEKFKICKKCGKEKHISFFHPRENDICDACAQKMKSEELLRKAKRIMGIIIPVAIVAGLVLAGISLTKSCTSHNAKDSKEEKIDTPYIDTNIQKVDKVELDSLIATGDFNAVYEYLKDKSDVDFYISSLKDTINQHLWLVINKSDLKNENAADDDLEHFYSTNEDLLDCIGFTDEDKSKWSENLKDYKVFWTIIKKQKISEEDFIQADSIDKRHNFEDVLPIMHYELVVKSHAIKGGNGIQIGQQNAVTTPTTYTLKYTDLDNRIVTKENVSESIKVEGLHGTYVTVSCNNGKIKENGRNICKVLLEKEREYTIKLTDSIVITITAVKKKINP